MILNKKKMQFDILTLFPEMFGACLAESRRTCPDISTKSKFSGVPFSESMIKRALEKGIVKINIHNLRNWAKDKHKTVDDTPYGGGAGMVMRVDIVDKAISNIKYQISKRSKPKNKKLKTILLTPQGKPFNQKIAQTLTEYSNLILICGHYEGFDERVREHLVDEEISIGDYILTGGELPAMVLVDVISRLIPGVLGKKESLKYESFSEIHPRLSTSKVRDKSASIRVLEYPQYTRPEVYRGWKVPKILLSGNHQEIETWRSEQALLRTKSRRPDLLK
jgi:tRNA (guanine37-N1)-methyltransferase